MSRYMYIKYMPLSKCFISYIYFYCVWHHLRYLNTNCMCIGYSVCNLHASHVYMYMGVYMYNVHIKLTNLAISF